MQLTVGGLLAVYGAHLATAWHTTRFAGLLYRRRSDDQSATGWCRGPHGRTVRLSTVAATSGVAGLWAVVSRPDSAQRSGRRHAGAPLHGRRSARGPDVLPDPTASRRAATTDVSCRSPALRLPGMSDGLYVLDRVTGVIEAIVPARPGRPDFILTGLALISDDGKTVVFSALEVSATGVAGAADHLRGDARRRC